MQTHYDTTEQVHSCGVTSASSADRTVDEYALPETGRSINAKLNQH